MSEAVFLLRKDGGNEVHCNRVGGNEEFKLSLHLDSLIDCFKWRKIIKTVVGQ